MNRSVRELFDLSSRVAVITGGGGLLGREYADILAAAGANIVIADFDGETAEKTTRKIEAEYQVRAVPIQVDISTKGGARRLVANTLREFDRLDILINNAALTVRSGTHLAGYFNPFENYELAIWEKALKVNITGMFLCAQEAGKQMIKQNRGVIVNISSTYGIVGPDQRIYEKSLSPYSKSVRLNTPVPYSVTKGAVLALTRYLAAYWAGKNIRVNTLTPGGVFDNHDPEFAKRYSSRTMLGRMANRDEYNGAILFLVSDASSYMTGANLVVDGGWTAW